MPDNENKENITYKIKDEKALVRAILQAVRLWYQDPDNRKKVEEYKRKGNEQEKDKQKVNNNFETEVVIPDELN